MRRVKQLLAFARFRDLVKDGYRPALGRTAEDPGRLIKREFWPFHYRLSDREVVAAAQVNMACRCCLEGSLERRLPVPSLLSQFRTRLGEQRHQARFDAVGAPARAHGLVHDRRRRKDATHMLANMAVPTTLPVVAQTRPRLLDRVRPDAPQRVADEAAAAARLRQVTADRKDLDRLAARVAHLRAIGAWADGVQQARGPLPSPPDPGRTRFEAALARAPHVLADRDDPDQGDQVRRVVDPEARRGTHGGSFDGSRLAMSLEADSERLGAVQVLPGNGAEAREAATLWQAEAQAQDHAMAAVSMDGLGGPGEVRRTRREPQGLGVEVYVAPRTEPAAGSLRPEQFTREPATGVLTCPGGHQTTAKERHANDTGWKFTFARRPCACCALPAPCLAALPQHQGRRVIKNDDQAESDAARERAQTARDAEVRRQHPRVERTLADIGR